MSNSKKTVGKITMSKLGEISKRLEIVTPRIDTDIVRKEDSTPWGESNDGFWMQCGPPWVQSASSPDDFDDYIIDFGGLLPNELLSKITVLDGQIIKGSNSEATWRLIIPKESVKEVQTLLKSNNASYIKVMQLKNK